MNNNALQIIPKPPRRAPNRKEAKIVGYAREIMELMHRDALNPKTKPLARASIARSFAILGDAIRVWRGIPSPGQLRPDLDPEQLTKALKRARSRKPILDMLASAHERPDETPMETTKGTPREANESKESLLPDGPVTTEGGGEGAETRGAPFHKP